MTLPKGLCSAGWMAVALVVAGALTSAGAQPAFAQEPAEYINVRDHIARAGHPADHTEAGDAVTLELTRDGKPAATIVVAEKPTRVAQLAAAELQEHIRKISGAILPIVSDTDTVPGLRILVGESAATRELGLKNADFQAQEYLIRFQPELLVLMGRDQQDDEKLDYYNPSGENIPLGTDEQGTCYAVYDFLERHCGVRWYLPTDLGTVYSTTPTLTVTGTERRRTPWMDLRTCGLEHSPNHLPYYRSGWYRIPADLIGALFTGRYEALPWREQVLFCRRLRHGGKEMNVGHSFYGYYARFWEQDEDPARAGLFEGRRPEFFAQGYEGRPPQLCYGSEALVQQVAKDARTFFDGKWQGTQDNNEGWIGDDYFPLGAMDDASRWCDCPDCRALIKRDANGPFGYDRQSINDYWFRFCNRVAREVRKTHPGKMLTTLSYNIYNHLPSAEPLEPNLAVVQVFDPRNTIWSSPDYAEWRNLLTDWRAQSQERQIYIWMHYLMPLTGAAYSGPGPYNVSPVQPPAWYPFPAFFPHHIVEQMRFYRDTGVRGMYIEDSKAPPYVQRLWLWDQLDLYLTFHLAYDPDQDGYGMIEEFFDRYYGAAAQPMRAFYEMVEEIHTNPNNYPYAAPVGQTRDIAWEGLGTAWRMEKLGRLMDEAKALARTEMEKARVDLFDRGIWQVMVTGRNKYLEGKAQADATMQAAQAPFCAAPEDRDPRKVDWSQAGVLGNWRSFDGKATERKIEGRVAHDGEYLYLRLQERMDTSRMVRDGASVWSGDDWELFFARSSPDYQYRQMGIDVHGTHLDHAYSPGIAGASWDSGARVYSDDRSPDCWDVYVALPLDKLLAGEGLQAGDTIYLNIVRATRGQVDGAAMWIPTLAQTFHTSNRLGRIVLARNKADGELK